MQQIPTPDTIDAKWLTERLRAGGHKSADVRGFTQTPIGTGQVGKCIRFDLDLAAGDKDTPRTLVGKFPSDNDLSRNSAVAMGIYEREVFFYRDLAPRLTISLPRCYYAQIDGQGSEFVLLMEDMHPAQQGDQLEGCSPEVVRIAVLELVGLQAPTWCDQDLAEQLTEPEDGFFSDMHGLYNQMLPAFLDRFAGSLAPDEVEIIQAVGRCENAPLFQPVGTPFCLEHRDYRPDNLLIDDSVSPPRVIVVDWQGLRVGRPLNDVALCLAGSLDPPLRREVETEIIREYHVALVQAGVKDFSSEQCWHEYRRASFAGFGLTVVSAVAVEQTARGDAMFTAMAHRYARHALDSGAAEFLT